MSAILDRLDIGMLFGKSKTCRASKRLSRQTESYQAQNRANFYVTPIIPLINKCPLPQFQRQQLKYLQIEIFPA